MVMVDELLEAGFDYAVTRFEVLSDNPFLVADKLGEPGLVENIAQTVAAMVGFHCYQQNVPVPIGYIAGLSDLRVLALPMLGSTIETSVKIRHQVMDVTVVEGKVEQDGQLLCSCEMKVVAKA